MGDAWDNGHKWTFAYELVVSYGSLEQTYQKMQKQRRLTEKASQYQELIIRAQQLMTEYKARAGECEQGEVLYGGAGGVLGAVVPGWVGKALGAECGGLAVASYYIKESWLQDYGKAECIYEQFSKAFEKLSDNEKYETRMIPIGQPYIRRGPSNIRSEHVEKHLYLTNPIE